MLPDHKIVYISTTKVACSSLRWMVADLVGEDFTRFYRAPGDHQTRMMTIHAHRSIWEHAPQIKHTPPTLLEQISRDNGWFVFAAVRDPWTRLFSAWQSKMLVRHASYVEKYGSQPWFPRVPSSPADVLADWRTFVRAAPWRAKGGLGLDPHFMPQVDSVHPDIVNYSHVYSLSEMGRLQRDLHEHLQGVGRDQELYLPRANKNPLRMTQECLDPETASIIDEAYRADFEAFPNRWDRETLRLSDQPWTSDSIDGVVYHGVANERIGDLSRELRGMRDELRTQRRELRRLTHEVSRREWLPGSALGVLRRARAQARSRRANAG